MIVSDWYVCTHICVSHKVWFNFRVGGGWVLTRHLTKLISSLSLFGGMENIDSDLFNMKVHEGVESNPTLVSISDLNDIDAQKTYQQII